MKNSWHSRWQDGKIGFHSDKIHNDLLQYKDFLKGQKHRVLVPLCGKSVDMKWLADEGHEVIGVELVPLAAQQFFSDNGLTPELRETENLQIYSAGRITILCGDIFNVERTNIGEIDRVWDRAAMVALPKDIRIRYVAHLRSIVAEQAKFLVNIFTYDTKVMDGPPYSITDSEVREQFAGCEIELLSKSDKLSDFLPFKERGHKYWQVSTYEIALPSAE